ncbi:MAG: TolC family protein [Bacteroidota bacterium]
MNRSKYIALTINSLILAGLAFLNLQQGFSQETLSLEEAVKTALENNQQIKIQQYNVDISTLRVHPSLVGRRPVLSLNGSYELGWSDANIETLSFDPTVDRNSEIELDGYSQDIIISPELSMNIYDGQSGKYRLDQLRTANDLAALQLRQTIEQTISEVSNAYLLLAEQQALVEITRQSTAVSLERLERIAVDESYGNAGSLQRLQVSVDLKSDSAGLRSQLLSVTNSRRNLNRLMGVELSKEYEVNTEVVVNEQLSLETLSTSLFENSTLLKLSQQNIKLADLDVALSKVAYRPQLQGYVNASYVNLTDDANFLQANRTFGPNVGLRLNMTLFDGGARKINKQTALLTYQQRNLERKDIEAELMKELQNAYAVYLNTLELLRIEKSNLLTFEKNLENMLNMQGLGLATYTDVRTAQLNLNAARNRIATFQFNIKQAEVALYNLSGQLINE